MPNSTLIKEKCSNGNGFNIVGVTERCFASEQRALNIQSNEELTWTEKRTKSERSKNRTNERR